MTEGPQPSGEDMGVPASEPSQPKQIEIKPIGNRALPESQQSTVAGPLMTPEQATQGMTPNADTASPPPPEAPAQAPTATPEQPQPEVDPRQQALQQLMASDENYAQLTPEQQQQLLSEAPEVFGQRIFATKAKLLDQMGFEGLAQMSPDVQKALLGELSLAELKTLGEVNELMKQVPNLDQAQTEEEQDELIIGNETRFGNDATEAASKWQKLKKNLKTVSFTALNALGKFFKQGILNSRSGDFIANFLVNSGGYGGGGAEYPWGAEQETETYPKNKFEQLLREHPQEFAKYLKVAYEKTDGLHTWLKDPKPEEALERAVEGSVEDLRQILENICEYLFNKDSAEKQKEVWQNLAKNLGEQMDPNHKLKLSGDIWELFKTEYGKGKGNSFKSYWKEQSSTQASSAQPQPAAA